MLETETNLYALNNLYDKKRKRGEKTKDIHLYTLINCIGTFDAFNFSSIFISEGVRNKTDLPPEV